MLTSWAWNAAKDVQGYSFGTPESIQAGAATLIIWADKRGIMWLPDHMPDETADEEDEGDELPPL